MNSKLSTLCSLVGRNGFSLFYQKGIDVLHQLRDHILPTYQQKLPFSNHPLHSFLQPVPLDVLQKHAPWIRKLAHNILDHRFNLLGSGWIRVHIGMECVGIENHRYATTIATPITSRINYANRSPATAFASHIDPSYQAIDWQLDFKSGYRWSEKTWYKKIRYGNLEGVDVKVPWELARMQHLPILVWAYALAQQGEHDFWSPDSYAQEWKNEVLDFIAHNPPRFGVNWSCPMDVAIRISNWLVTYDLFRTYGVPFDPAFDDLFLRSVYDHALHILQNLEWNPILRGNHYLANLAGLILVAVYLPSTEKTNGWLRFAIQELFEEFRHQFHPDGSHFEASTAYHRLSCEMVLYAFSFIRALPEDRISALTSMDSDSRTCVFRPGYQPAPLSLYPLPRNESKTSLIPPWVFERLENCVRFARDVCDSKGQIIQIGDNDNGRFFKFHPVFSREEAQENHLDVHPLLSAFQSFFSGSAGESTPDCIDSCLINMLVEHTPVKRDPSLHFMDTIQPRVDSETFDLTRNLHHVSYPDFGLYIYRSSMMKLFFRCGSKGQNGHGGHAHNDQLSLILYLFHQPVLVDPGTYLYTPLPHQRNRFRSTAMHNTLSVRSKEQHPWLHPSQGLFFLLGDAKPQVLSCTDQEIMAQHVGFGTPHQRTLHIESTRISGFDVCSEANKTIHFHLAPHLVCEKRDERSLLVPIPDTPCSLLFQSRDGQWTLEESAYSRGYGEREPARVLCLQSECDRIEWNLEILKTS